MPYFGYMQLLAEIGIELLNEKRLQCYEEKLCNMDEGIDQASRG